MNHCFTEEATLINFKKLQYFLTVAEEGQITKAAKKLCIAQPPLTHQLKTLEEELGVKLIKKIGRNIQLTEAGYALRDSGEQILELVNKAQKELKDIEQGEAGTLSIGSVTAWGATVLPDQICNYSLKYPKIRFQIYDGDNNRITNLLSSGVVEIGVVLFPIDTSIYESIHLPSEPMVAAMNKKWDDHPEMNSISLKDLSDKPLIIHRLSERTTTYYQEQNLEPNIICVHNDIRSMLALASTGLGVTIVPKSSASLKQDNTLIYKEITDPILPLSINIIWRRNRYLSKIAQNFLGMFTADAKGNYSVPS
ncbi:MAG: transcriptional regulator, LysR family [Firmicutes bacterium]|nr:transcriptional regulator, LysR family [Bacillota bacterium]